jgi:hypothetical protein
MSYDEHLISMAGGDGEFEKKLQQIGAKYAHMYVPRKSDNAPLGEFKVIEDESADGEADVLGEIEARVPQIPVSEMSRAERDRAALLAMVREQRAQIERVLDLLDSNDLNGVLVVNADRVRAALGLS